MIMTYKIVTGKVKLEQEGFFTFAENQTNRGSQSCKLGKPKAVKDVLRNSFSTRVVNDWNNLPQERRDDRNNQEIQMKDRHILGNNRRNCNTVLVTITKLEWKPSRESLYLSEIYLLYCTLRHR